MLALASAGIEDGHVAVAFVDEQSGSQTLNRDHRGKDAPTDVLSFPIDGRRTPSDRRPRELGDIVICPPHTEDLREAVVHGVLHLTGMDHETDDGEMLALQAELLRWVHAVTPSRRRPAAASSRSPGGRTSASRRSSTRSSARKVAIVSDKPQTTRRAIRGVATTRRLAARARRPARRPAPARRADRSACSGASSASWPTRTPRC